jgi:hypothetical protein
MLRLSMFGFIVAALATLFDQGTLWQFTLDPSRRLALTVYWMGHAAIIGAMLLRLQALQRTESKFLHTLIELALLGLLGSALIGLILADGLTLIELALADAAPGAIAVIVAAFMLRFIWRMFAHADASPLGPVDDNTGEAKWRDVLLAAALVPPALLFLVLMYTLFGFTWRSAHLFLDYAVQARDWAQLDWNEPIRPILWRSENLTIHLVMGAIVIAWIFLDKLLVRPKTPTPG